MLFCEMRLNLIFVLRQVAAVSSGAHVFLRNFHYFTVDILQLLFVKAGLVLFMKHFLLHQFVLNSFDVVGGQAAARVFRAVRKVL